MREACNSKSCFQTLFFRVLVGIIARVVAGCFFPKFGASLKPPGDGFLKATLVVGTDVVDEKNTSTAQIRDTSIRNGIERKVSAGDVINMPAGLSHQFLLEPGKQITYIDVVVNTTEK